ncbi:MAG: transcriptional repressor NrdR [Clostridiales bacterium]|nr:transcriptional repressor NrdR [Clostridiales bacterium]
MKCPYCGFEEDKVIDSRPTEEGYAIRRRRECIHCLKRFTTYENIERKPLMVIKRDRSRQVFDSSKLLNRLLIACAKRPIPIATLEQIVEEVENSFLKEHLREITSTAIGDMVLAKLKDIDDVAYVRFASVYRDFDDVDTFVKEIKNLKKLR